MLLTNLLNKNVMFNDDDDYINENSNNSNTSTNTSETTNSENFDSSNSESEFFLEKNNERPTFFYRNDRNKKIRAGGIIYYKYINNEIHFLMIKCNGMYEDFGGKTDIDDNCIEDTVSREAEEESNNIFIRSNVYKKLICDKSLYSWRLKYVVYIQELTQLELVNEPQISDFGIYEEHAQIFRTVEWVPCSKLTKENFIYKKLHHRLRFKKFFSKINELSKINLVTN